MPRRPRFRELTAAAAGFGTIEAFAVAAARVAGPPPDPPPLPLTPMAVLAMAAARRRGRCFAVVMSEAVAAPSAPSFFFFDFLGLSLDGIRWMGRTLDSSSLRAW